MPLRAIQSFVATSRYRIILHLDPSTKALKTPLIGPSLRKSSGFNSQAYLVCLTRITIVHYLRHSVIWHTNYDRGGKKVPTVYIATRACLRVQRLNRLHDRSGGSLVQYSVRTLYIQKAYNFRESVIGYGIISKKPKRSLIWRHGLSSINV